MQKHTHDDHKTRPKKSSPVPFDQRDTLKQPRVPGDVGEEKGRELQGEGNYEAGRRYDEDAQTFARSGEVEPAAREAAAALDDDEELLDDAEEEGRLPPKGA